VIAAVAAAVGVVPWTAWGAVALAGAAGALADTLLGAWGQQRRWCSACRTDTEQDPHACGTATQLAGGWGWLDNDAVNLLATVVGALSALVLRAVLRGPTWGG
jgi:uncharacterized membrane protein